MLYGEGEVGKIIDLLPAYATVDTVQDFLRDQEVPFTAKNWDDLLNRRLRQELVPDGDIQHDALVRFLRDSEEFGRQHVFLYRVSREAADFAMRRNRVENELKNRGLGDLADQPRIHDMPDSPELVDVRWEKNGRADTMVVKIVEKRTRTRRVASEVHDPVLAKLVKGYTGGTLFARIFKTEEVRAVSVFRLHSFGLLELRIFSHRTTSGKKYRDDLNQLWKVVGQILPRDRFEGKAWSLAAAKKRFLTRREEFAGEIRYSDSGLRSLGSTIVVATGRPEGTLFDNDLPEKAIDIYVNGGAKCDHLNLWWEKQPDGGTPSRAIHVMLGGQRNEFAITGKCSRRDYEHVLKRIRQNN